MTGVRGVKEGDRQIGAAIRKRRIALGMTQGDLGKKVGVTYQQIFKNETGVNRVSGSRLLAVAQALDCTVSDLLGDLDAPIEKDVRSRRFLNLSDDLSVLPDEEFEALRHYVHAMAKRHRPEAA